MKNKKFTIGIAIFVVIAGFAGWYIHRDLRSAEPPQAAVPPASLTPSTLNVNAPNLDREIVVKETLPENVKNKIIAEIKEISGNLKNDYNNRENWLQLGLLRKALGDYEGTAEAWEFLALIRPKDTVVFSNLGELYHLYLPDFPRAEANFKKAIENDPKNILAYEKLHELYRYSYKEKSNLAAAILLKGIEATNEPYLKKLLEEYREETQ